jgi:hypothetical protein
VAGDRLHCPGKARFLRDPRSQSLVAKAQHISSGFISQVAFISRSRLSFSEPGIREYFDGWDESNNARTEVQIDTNKTMKVIEWIWQTGNLAKWEGAQLSEFSKDNFRCASFFSIKAYDWHIVRLLESHITLFGSEIILNRLILLKLRLLIQICIISVVCHSHFNKSWIYS